MNHFLAAVVGLLVAMFICGFAMGFAELSTWTEGQRVWTSFIMGSAFITPLFLGYLNGDF